MTGLAPVVACCLLFAAILPSPPARAAQTGDECTVLPTAPGRHALAVPADGSTVAVASNCGASRCTVRLEIDQRVVREFVLPHGRPLTVCARRYEPSGVPHGGAACGDTFDGLRLSLESKGETGLAGYLELRLVWLQNSRKPVQACIKLIDAPFEFDGSGSALQPVNSWYYKIFRVTEYEFRDLRF